MKNVFNFSGDLPFLYSKWTLKELPIDCVDFKVVESVKLIVGYDNNIMAIDIDREDISVEEFFKKYRPYNPIAITLQKINNIENELIKAKTKFLIDFGWTKTTNEYWIHTDVCGSAGIAYVLDTAVKIQKERLLIQ